MGPEMNQKTYQKEAGNDPKHVQQIMQKKVTKIIQNKSKQLPQIDSQITPTLENWDPNFWISFLINFGPRF